MIRLRYIFVIAVLVGLGCTDRNSNDDFLPRKVTVNGKEYQYRVFVPKGPSKQERRPMMLYLHGSGSAGDDNRAQSDAFAVAIAKVKGQVDFIVVLPQCRKNTFWAAKDMADYSLAALEAAVSEFNGDNERLYLAGFSLGGYGVWQISAGTPGKFAALMPVAGGVVGRSPIDPNDRAAIIPEVGTILESAEPYQGIAKAVGQTPVWVFHGAKDESVPVQFSRTIVKALEDEGNNNVKYTEYPDEGHLIFGKSFGEPGFLEWLAQQRLKKMQ